MSGTLARNALLATIRVAIATTGLACSRPDASSPPPDAGSDASAAATASAAPATSAPAASSAARSAPAAPAACRAPSLFAHEAIDGRTRADLARCTIARKGGVPAPVPPSRLDAAVLPLDEATLAHVRAVARRGRELGRNPRSFGLVGDSITVGGFYLDAFGVGSPFKRALSDDVRAALATPVDGDASRTIIDFYRGVHVEGDAHWFRDAFRATRAAKVGARSDWVLPLDDHSPVITMIDAISPAVAVVMFGTNDAAYKVEAPEDLAREFGATMGQIVDALEARGVVPVLSTIPRHVPKARTGACDVKRLSPWRIVVQTNAVNAAVAELACARQLPLVDYRAALDELADQGVGHDGIHPSAYPGGPGKLTPKGLGYGWNARSYVTLRMLKELKEQVFDRLGGAPR